MRLLTLISSLAVVMLCSCGMIRKIPVPPLPSMNTIAAIIPGMDEKDKASGDDPDMPFNSRSTLGYGHTLRLEVYEGARDASRIYRGIVMVDREGLLKLDSAGSARVAGLHLPQAAEAIATTFRLAGRNTRPVTVHIVSVENTPVLSINGDLKEAAFIPAFEKMGVQHAVSLVGGRKPGSSARGVYIARDGKRSFFSSIQSAETKWQLRAGDIVTLSPDI